MALPLITIPRSTLPSTQVMGEVCPCNHCSGPSLLSIVLRALVVNLSFLFSDSNMYMLPERCGTLLLLLLGFGDEEEDDEDDADADEEELSSAPAPMVQMETVPSRLLKI